MSAKPKLAGQALFLLALSTCILFGCSSSHPRDINYGTDAGLGYVPPDSSPVDSTSAAETAFDVQSIDVQSDVQSDVESIDVQPLDGADQDLQSLDSGDQTDAANDTNN